MHTPLLENSEKDIAHTYIRETSFNSEYMFKYDVQANDTLKQETDQLRYFNNSRIMPD